MNDQYITTLKVPPETTILQLKQYISDALSAVEKSGMDKPYTIKVVMSDGVELDPVIFRSNDYDKVNLMSFKDKLDGGKIKVSLVEGYISLWIDGKKQPNYYIPVNTRVKDIKEMLQKWSQGLVSYQIELKLPNNTKIDSVVWTSDRYDRLDFTTTINGEAKLTVTTKQHDPDYLSSLPREVLWEITKELPIEEVVNLCSANKELNSKICEQKVFWLNRIRYELGYETIPDEVRRKCGDDPRCIYYRLQGGTLWTFGRGTDGQLGNGEEEKRSSPMEIMRDIRSVSCGALHTAAIDSQSRLWTFGSNVHGQLGIGTETRTKSKPVAVMDNVRFVSCGHSATAAIDHQDQLWMFGDNIFGQLGDGTTVDKPTPTKIMENVRYVSCGNLHTAVIDRQDQLWMFGWNCDGQLGDGTTVEKLIPVKIMENVKSVSCGHRYTAVIDHQDQLWTFGGNTDGRLGDGTVVNKLIPTKIMENVIHVSCGTFHTAAIDHDGNLWMFGNNAYGQFGNGIVVNKLIPTKVMENIRYVSCGSFHTAAIDHDGNLLTFGSNAYGELGISDRRKRVLLPVVVMTAVREVSCGSSHTAVIEY